jgi:diguanylate cyclase (GGDEF)-like protein
MDRDAFLRLVDAAMDNATNGHRALGLVVLQLQNFDLLSSALGFAAASRVTAEVEQLTRRAVRTEDVVVRLGDAKFAVVLGAMRNDSVLLLAASKLDNTLNRPMRVGDTDVSLVLRIGMASGPSQADCAEELLRCAETALLTAIAKGERYVNYSAGQREQATESLDLEQELERAIERGEFEVCYQPKVRASDGSPVGAEALLRWNNPQRGPISPNVFIPLAERTGAIEALTTFVIQTAARQSAEWPRYWGPLSVAVNVTPRVLEAGDLPDLIADALAMWNGVANQFIVEVTEGVVMRDPEHNFAVLRGLRASGLRISIDDFGTGYSSLAYFKNIPTDELKIDKSFIANILEDEGDRKIVRAVVDLSKAFGFEVTAEGVENQGTAALLAELGCDCLQGYFYSPPLRQRDFVAWLQQHPQPAVRRA